ncbi:MAG: NnrU family protein [Betaproteobacteria bacterium]|nr:NnrU family protein [Betaproteobacteria bacterium]
MTGTLFALLVAMVGFAGSHFLLSWPPVRSRLVATLGERPFLGVYSLVSAVFLVWVVLAYRGAPFVGIWELGLFGRFIAACLMPIALVLAVIGLTTPNPTAVGGERLRDASRAARGIVTITRHPFLWGVALWAVAHLAANGDAASAMLFGGMLILSLGGMAAIDHKRALRLGDAWQAFSGRTSLVPFAAAAAGRVKVDWKGIGWWRLGLGVVVYLILLLSHRWLFGVPAIVA